MTLACKLKFDDNSAKSYVAMRINRLTGLTGLRCPRTELSQYFKDNFVALIEDMNDIHTYMYAYIHTYRHTYIRFLKAGSYQYTNT